MTEKAKLIVGLGNPGNEYSQTRHNIGFMVLDSLGKKYSLNWKEKFKGVYAQISSGEEKIYFLKPQTFMNLSGESLSAICTFFKIEISDILVVYDEIELPFGTLVFKKGGGLAGHNGLKSIVAQLGSQDFLRLRMGVGRPVHGDVAGYVLSKFSSEEKIPLERILDGATKAVVTFIESGFEKAASENSKKDYLKN
jgi:peptidyl-tRNA hydrolase, PTH1 family